MSDSKSAGFPKIKITGKGTFRPPTPKTLTRDCQIGEHITQTIGDVEYTGILKEWDANKAIVELADGQLAILGWDS